MKRTVLILMFAMMAMVYSQAQQIAVVTGNSTTLCQTLKEALDAARNGSVIYLPAGGFQIGTDSIKRKVTIIGVGHKANSNNADGNTVISGELCFNQGSSGSAVMGCYISGDVKIGYDGNSVNNIVVKYCNFNSMQVNNNQCTGTIVNQNYIRNGSAFRGAPGLFTNNVAHSINDLDGGKLLNNIVTSGQYNYYEGTRPFIFCDNCTIANNILLNYAGCGASCIVSSNMCRNGEWGDDPINIGDVDWNDVFSDYNNGTITPASIFHFSDAYSEYEGRVGIYAGSGFSDSAMPPVPYISFKSIPEQTDNDGKLKIKIRVKASE